MVAKLFNHISSLNITIVAVFLAACSSTITTDTAVPVVTAHATESQGPASFVQHELEPTYEAMIAEQRDPRIPELPFLDNPDPSQCGIPVKWGKDEPAWLNGIYGGELIQPMVLLYDSHLRLGISGEAPHGSEVTIILFQENPVIDYYMVEVKGAGETIKGWIPAPLLSFEPLETLDG
ncbi:MAG: hypothetical protein ACK2U5_09630 [Candidatus Promineifilaceae bacterium]|jgi:hypothetical protein